MGVVIRSSAVSRSSQKTGSAELMAQAGALCIQNAGIPKKDVDLLVSTGIYHDENIVEPAMAPLIQQKLDLNVHPHAHLTEEGHRTFSFDLMNGSCGFLYAVQVVEALINAGKARNVLVLSGDIHPSGEPRADFPFSHVGAAALLSGSAEREKGFGRFAFRTSPTYHNGMEGFEDASESGGRGREEVTITVQEGYYQELLAFAVDAIKEYLGGSAAASGLTLITSQPIEGFATQVSHALGMADDAVIDSYKEYGSLHTAALSLGFHQATKEGRARSGDRLLFVDVGSGMTAAVALYNC